MIMPNGKQSIIEVFNGICAVRSKFSEVMYRLRKFRFLSCKPMVSETSKIIVLDFEKERNVEK